MDFGVDFYNRLLDAGLATVSVVLIMIFLIMLIRVAKPLIEQFVAGFATASAGYDSVLKVFEAQNKTLELYVSRLQGSLDREEDLTQQLRTDLLTANADIARLEAQLREQQRLRDLDLQRIRDLETNQKTDKAAIQELNRKLTERDQEIIKLNTELDELRRQREMLTTERNERDTVIVGMQAQIDNLSTRLQTQEIKTGDGHDK